MQSSPDSRCPRCGGSTAPSTSGRITQWVFACTCAVVEPTEEADDLISVVICQTCGKRLNQGRVGSFTQWVFRSDLCSCETPNPIETKVQTPDPQASLFEITIPNDLSSALEIEPDKFPTQRYRPFSIIGKGASGVVYLAVDLVLDKRVAIKTLHSVEASQLILFQQEAKTTSSLNHDNIVTILDFGATEGGVPFMVMELVNGFSLKDAIEESGPMSEASAVAMAHQVCKGLSFAHEHGVLHRDLKSSNILIADLDTETPTAKIIDFGVAGLKLAGNESSLGETKKERGSQTELVGSPLYMAPDQPLGHTYDERSEIYSLGCCLFEALTGSVPFHGETALETMSMHAKQIPPRLSEASSERIFNEHLEMIVARCLSKNREQRFASADELERELANLLESGVLIASEDTATEYAQANPGIFSFWPASFSLLDENKKVLIGAAAAILIVVAVTSWSVLNNVQDQSKRPPPPTAKLHKIFDGRYKFNEKKFSGAVENDFQLGPALKNDIYLEPSETKSRKDKLSGIQGSIKNEAILDALQDDDHPEFSYSKEKHGLSITGTGGINDQHLAQLAGKKITTLALVGQKVTGTGLKYLRDSGIVNLTLDSCPITEEGMKEVGQLKTLHSLQLRTTPVDDKGLTYIENLPLTFIILRRTEVTDECVKSLVKMKDLNHIILFGTAVTMAGITPLSTLPDLEGLDIANITPSPDLKGIEKFTKLHTLDVSDIGVTDEGVERLVALPLVSLKVNRSNVTDVGAMKFKNKTSLKELQFHYCANISPTTIRNLQERLPGTEIGYRRLEDY